MLKHELQDNIKKFRNRKPWKFNTKLGT